MQLTVEKTHDVTTRRVFVFFMAIIYVCEKS